MNIDYGVKHQLCVYIFYMFVPVQAGFQSRNGSRESGLESLRFVSEAFDGLRDRPDDDSGVAANGDCNLWVGKRKTKIIFDQTVRWIRRRLAPCDTRHKTIYIHKLFMNYAHYARVYDTCYVRVYGTSIMLCYGQGQHNKHNNWYCVT